MKIKSLILISINLLIISTVVLIYFKKSDSIIGIYVNEEPAFIASWELNLLPNNTFVYYYGDCTSKKYSEGFWENNDSEIILNSSKEMRKLFKLNKGKSSFISDIPNTVQEYENQAIQELEKSENEKESNSQDFALGQVNISLKDDGSVKYVNNDTIELFENFELKIENNRLINPTTGFSYIKRSNENILR